MWCLYKYGRRGTGRANGAAFERRERRGVGGWRCVYVCLHRDVTYNK